MLKHDIKSMFYTFIDVTGLTKIFTSITATLVSFNVTSVAQLVAIFVGIISGCMAIRHYAVVTKLNKERLERLRSGDEQMMDVEETS